MKKTFRNFLGIWAVLLVLFHVIAFVAVGWTGQEKYTPSFWIGYAGIVLCFIVHLFCGWYVLREENRQKRFYKISILRVSYHGLIWSFVIGGACMLISPLPYWVGTILCAFILAVTVISIFKASAAADLVEKVDKGIQAQIAFIRDLTVTAEGLLAQAKTDAARSACKKVYEAVRYSDPRSSQALLSLEQQISAQMDVLATAVAEGSEGNIATATDEIVALITARNSKCKAEK